MMMKLLVVVACCAALVSATWDTSFTAFEAYTKKFGKQYKSPADRRRAYDAFVSNADIATQMAARNPHATFGLTRFSDKIYSKDAQDRVLAPVKPAVKVAPGRTEATPEQVNWVTKGATVPVQDQGQCGDCMAFALSENAAGINFVANGKLVPVSVAEIVACDGNGCNGNGENGPSKIVEFFMTHSKGWLEPESEQPWPNYTHCNPKVGPPGVQLNGMANVPNNEAGIAAFCATNGPTAVLVDALSWQTYQSGILTSCGGGSLDHNALIVGYDLSNSPPYWILQNSWGSDWGEQGYIRIEYGSNQCGIRDAPWSVKVVQQ